MKAPCIVFTKPRTAETGEIEIGSPGPGQIVTKTLLTGVSTGTETRVFRGKQDGSSFPLIPGYENLGEVVEAGPAVTLKPGTRVYVRGHQYDPSPYTTTWGSQVGGSLASAASAIPIPDGVPNEHAIYAKVCGISLHGAKRARVRDGEWAVVVGLGIIGHFVLQHAVARGAKVIGIDVDAGRLELAAKAGATHTVNGRDADAVERVREITGGGATVAFDATGLASTLEGTAAYLRVRPWDTDPGDAARLVLQGTVEEPVTLGYRTLFAPEIDLITPRDCDTADLVDSLSLMAAGKIDPGIIPATTYHYTKAAEAYPRLVEREIMRVLFTWE